MNLLGPELVRDLVSLIQRAEADGTAQVLVFKSGDPDYFISHVDVTPIKEYRAQAAKLTGEASIALLFRHLTASRLVTIAQIEGRVRAAGSEFVLAAHRIAGFPAAGQVAVKDRVNAIAVAPVGDFRRDSDLFAEAVQTPAAQSRIGNALSTASKFETRKSTLPSCWAICLITERRRNQSLLALLAFGIVTIFVSIPHSTVIWSVVGLVVFGGYTVLDFNRVRRSGEDQAMPIAASIFLDVLNVFLFLLQIFWRD